MHVLAFVALGLLAALNPKLLGMDLVLMAGRRPHAMLAVFAVGALGLSVVIGIVDVLILRLDVLHLEDAFGAGVDVVLGVLLLVAGRRVAAGRLFAPREGTARRGANGAVRAQQLLQEPRLRLALLAGLLCGVPGATYIAVLGHLVRQPNSASADVAAVVAFNLIMFSPVLIPLVLLRVWPDRIQATVRSLDDWIVAHARVLIGGVAMVVGAYLLISGVVRLVG